MESNLLEEYKNEFGITWKQDDAKLSRYLRSGKQYLSETMGASIDFEVDERAKTLLFDYVRYARSNSLEYFTNNFSTEIFTLQMKYAINAKNNKDT